MEFKVSDNEVEDMEAQIEVDVVRNAVFDVKEEWLDMCEMQKFETSVQIRDLGSSDDTEHKFWDRLGSHESNHIWLGRLLTGFTFAFPTKDLFLIVHKVLLKLLCLQYSLDNILSVSKTIDSSLTKSCCIGVRFGVV